MRFPPATRPSWRIACTVPIHSALSQKSTLSQSGGNWAFPLFGLTATAENHRFSAVGRNVTFRACVANLEA